MLLQHLDAFCSKYQKVECLYTIFKELINGNSVVKSGLFDNGQKAVYFDQRSSGVDILTSIARKKLKKENWRTPLEFIPKDEINAN